ncbi:MAG TPA: LysR substrate-binding domain-containing protein [Pseudolabrys sp.]|jgi:DNA-binding transcriptional LysR family regulator
MMDIDLLRSFVSVVDAGGFTKASERVHRTQSTVSQQIKRLEDQLGRSLLERNGKQAILTEEGERLLSYARRILALEQEAREVVARPMTDGVVRLGIPEDFAAYRLAELLSDFVRARPTLRLDVSSGRSVAQKRALELGELDIALYKRNAGDGQAIASWPERLQWVTSRKHPVDLKRDPIPLAVAEQGCLYRNRLIHAIEAAGRTWHIAYTSPNLPGIQAAVSVGLGVSILPDVAILPDHKIINETGLPPITNTELALVVADHASPATRHLAKVLAEFCSNFEPRDSGGFQPGKQRLAANA